MTVLDFELMLTRIAEKYPWFNKYGAPHSMTSTEMYFICSHLARLQPEVVFESGVYQGRSTVVWSEFMMGKGQVVAAHYQTPRERARLYPFRYDNLNLVRGRGEEVVKILDRHKRTVCIIDGPKPYSYHRSWVALMEQIRTFDNILMVFQHDVKQRRPRWAFVRYYRRRLADRFALSYIPQSFLQNAKVFGRGKTDQNVGVFTKRMVSI